MKRNSDRPFRRDHPVPQRRVALERDTAAVREPVSDYFTLYLLQEILSSIGLRHKH
jgi:hypothetical protein